MALVYTLAGLAIVTVGVAGALWLRRWLVGRPRESASTTIVVMVGVGIVPLFLLVGGLLAAAGIRQLLAGR